LLTKVHRLVERAHDLKIWGGYLTTAKHWREVMRLPPRAWLDPRRRGFSPFHYRFWRIDRSGPDQFLNDRQVRNTAKIDGPYGVVLDDKVLFELVMQRYVRVPRNFARLQRGRLIWLDGGTPPDRSLHSLLQERKKLVVKPVDQNGGRGVRLLEYRKGLSPQDLLSGSEDVIISEHIEQGAYSSSLYPGSVNTVRMLTLRDRADQSSFVAMAVQRIGCAQSAPVDNVSRGGLSCAVDLETGQLGKVIKYKSDDPFQFHDRHPDTGKSFEGVVVPDWRGICSKMIELADKFPMLPYVAWDVALLDDDIVVIEGNSWTGLGTLQRERPLLADPRVRRFYEAYGIL